MSFALVVFVLADAAAGFACVRMRCYAHAIGLGGVAVPIAMVTAAVVFNGISPANGALTTAQRSQALLLGFGALVVAMLGVGWMALAATRRWLSTR